MYNEYDNERSGYTYPPAPGAGSIAEAPHMQAPISGVQQAGAPAERTDAPVILTAPRVQQMFTDHAPAEQVPQATQPVQTMQPAQTMQAYAPYSAGWSEPAYSTAHETTSNMYTPGIYINQPLPRKRASEAGPKRHHHENGRRLGRFLRAACLIIICAVLSGASAYMVTEYRLKDIDFAPVNQVVIGGAGSVSPQGGSLTPTIATTGPGMSAEDIYDISCTQVVGIKTEMPNAASSFGGLIPGSSTAVSGSGFIISSDGYILTNYHVVETAYLNDLPLIVCLNDGTEYEAAVVGYEVLSDVALIKINATGLNAAVIANSDNIRVGQRVYAVGNPFGVDDRLCGQPHHRRWRIDTDAVRGWLHPPDTVGK